MFEQLLKIWNTKDLRNKILIILGLLLAFRVLAHIPIPGISLDKLASFFNSNNAFGLLDMFSGGGLKSFSLVMMGVGPYITASIIFQLLGMIIPQLEALQKEGEAGREKINYWTRIATVPLAIMQSYAMIALLKNQGIIGDWSTFTLITNIITLTAGTVLLMWIGELISEQGLGNGLSIIIALGILTAIPTSLGNTIQSIDLGATQIFALVGFAAILLAVVISIVVVNEGERQIPVTYARRIRGNRTLGGVDTYLPLKVLMAGVIPIIFGLSLLIMPGVIGKFLELARSAWIVDLGKSITNLFNDQVFYNIFYFVLVIGFTYFYTFVIFHPDQIAENLQKQGGFIPGIRPGNETSKYLKYIVNRITLAGALFLGIIAVLPFVVQSLTGINTIVLGGTGILIVVSVVLETYRQVKAQMVMRTYDNY